MYNWKNDIIDIENLPYSETRELLYVMCGEDDPINVFMIKYNSKLYDYLERWFDYNSGAYIRSCKEYNEFLTFVTGCNYAIYDNDLLGGNADGKAEKCFDMYVDFFEKNGQKLNPYNTLACGCFGTFEDASTDKMEKVLALYEKEHTPDKIGHSCRFTMEETGTEVSIDYGDHFSGVFTMTIEKW